MPEKVPQEKREERPRQFAAFSTGAYKLYRLQLWQ